MFKLSHFKALSRKNLITWMRTPVGSAMEILLSVLLMILLAVGRKSIELKPIDNASLFDLRHPLYPVASPTATGWALNSNGATSQQLSYSDTLL
jgi:hypothetical protein